MDYYEQLNINKFDNLSEMDTYPEIQKLLNFTKEEIDNQNSSISFKENEFILKSPPQKKTLGPCSFIGK